MKRNRILLPLAFLAALGLIGTFGTEAEAGDSWGVGLRIGGATIQFGNAGYGHYGYRPHHTYRHGYRHPVYRWGHHDRHGKSHYDWRRGHYSRHGSHYDHVPGRYGYRHDGRWDYHHDKRWDYRHDKRWDYRRGRHSGRHGRH